MTADRTDDRDWIMFAERTVHALNETGFREHGPVFRPLEDVEDGLAVGVNMQTDEGERPLLLEEATAIRDAAAALPHVVAEVQRLRRLIDEVRATS